MKVSYAKCKLNPDDLDFVKKFKELHPDFKEDLLLEHTNEKSVFTFIVLTYDINSPFVFKHKDWAQRRKEVAKVCGFKMNGIHFIEEVEKIIIAKNRRVNKCILRYLFLQNDLEFIKYHSYQAMYYRQVQNSLEKDFDKPSDSEKLMQNIENLSLEIKKLQDKIFKGDESASLKRSLYEFVSLLYTDFSPEDRAERINNGEPPVDDVPYPPEYVPEDLKFVGDE